VKIRKYILHVAHSIKADLIRIKKKKPKKEVTWALTRNTILRW
jgi:hypothetical protein